MQEVFCAMLYVTGESAPQAQDYARVPDVNGWYAAVRTGNSAQQDLK